MLETGEEQAKRLGSQIYTDEVLKIEYNQYFKVVTKNSEYVGKVIILATGIGRKNVNIKGIKQYEGKGISYCAVCDGFFYRNKNVAVIGNGDYALNEVRELMPIVNSVSILTNGKKIVENRDLNLKVDIVEKQIKEFRGTEVIENIVFEDDTIMDISGVFVAEGIATSTDLARKLGIILDEKGNIIVNEKMETNVPNIYACGDCTGGLLQISKAVYEGSKAGIEIIKKLRNI